MPIHITVDDVLNRFLQYRLASVPEEQREEALPRAKYNLLVDAFHISTVLLVTAVVSAILFAHTTALVLGTIGLFTRKIALEEQGKYTRPPLEKLALLAEIVRRECGVKGFFGKLTCEERVVNIFRNIGFQSPKDWTEHEIYVFGYPVWMNKIPEVSARMERAPS